MSGPAYLRTRKAIKAILIKTGLFRLKKTEIIKRIEDMYYSELAKSCDLCDQIRHRLHETCRFDFKCTFGSLNLTELTTHEPSFHCNETQRKRFSKFNVILTIFFFSFIASWGLALHTLRVHTFHEN